MHQRTPILTIALLCSALSHQAGAETVIPLQGQAPEQIQADIAACQAQGKSAHDQALASSNAAAPAATPTAPPPSGGRLRGAAVGAAAGAASAQVQGNRYDNYDNIDSDIQQEYRQNQAHDAAAAGAVIGGAKQRQSRRQQQQAQQQQAQQQSSAATQSADAASSQAYSSCMGSKGYSISQ